MFLKSITNLIDGSRADLNHGIMEKFAFELEK